MLALLLTLDKSFPISVLPLPLTYSVLTSSYQGWDEGLEHLPRVSTAFSIGGSRAVVECQNATAL